MKRILRKIAFMCAVLVMASVMFIFAATLAAMRICYSNEYLLELIGVNPEPTHQEFVIKRRASENRSNELQAIGSDEKHNTILNDSLKKKAEISS